MSNKAPQAELKIFRVHAQRMSRAMIFPLCAKSCNQPNRAGSHHRREIRQRGLRALRATRINKDNLKNRYQDDRKQCSDTPGISTGLALQFWKHRMNGQQYSARCERAKE